MMTKTNTRRVAMTIAVLMAVLVMVACVPWFVVRAGEPPAAEPDSSQGIQITSYTVSKKGSIVKDDQFSLTVSYLDTRVTTDDSPKGLEYTIEYDLTYSGKGNIFQTDIYYNTNESTDSSDPPSTKIIAPVSNVNTASFSTRATTVTSSAIKTTDNALLQKAKTVTLAPVTLVLNQCVEYVAPPPPEPASSIPEPDSSEPLVIGTGFALKSVDFGGSEVMAGTSFNLNLTLIATSGTYSVNNVAVAVTPSEQFSIAAGASNIYIGTVRPGATVPVTVPLTPSATVAAGSYPVVMSVSGVNAHDGASVNAEITVTIPIAQPERFEISNVQAPSMLTAGMDDGSGFTSVTLVNKGKGTIYNVSVNVVGEGLSSSEGPQFIGNIAAGSENGADLTVLAATPGSIDGQIVVTYENEKGEEKTLTHSFTVDVQDMGMIDPGMGMDPMMPIEPPPENQGIPYWFWIILGVGAVTAVVITVAVVKKRRAKKAAALDDDFDEDRE